MFLLVKRILRAFGEGAPISRFFPYSPLFCLFSKRRWKRREVINQMPRHSLGHLCQWAESPGRTKSGDGYSFFFSCQICWMQSERTGDPQHELPKDAWEFCLLPKLSYDKQAWDPPWSCQGSLLGSEANAHFLEISFSVVPSHPALMDVHCITFPCKWLTQNSGQGRRLPP